MFLSKNIDIESTIQLNPRNLRFIYIQQRERIIIKMKKYVSKDDVEKGLVDPTKPLAEQKDYVEKIQQEQKKKGHKMDKKEGFKKRQRPNRPQYNWNRRDVTEQTPIPEAPKKVVNRPDKDKYHEKLDIFRKELDNLYDQKNNLHNQMKFALKSNNENKRTGQAVKSKFSTVLKEKNNLKKILEDQMQTLEGKRDKVENQMKQIKSKINSLRKPDNFAECSTEQLKRRLEKTEQKLTTEDLDKQGQNRINQKILEIKRAITKSRPQAEVSAQIGRLQNEDDLLFNQLKNVRQQIKSKYNELKEVRGEIAKIMEQKSSEQVVTVQVRNPEEIKASYEKKLEQIHSKREEVKKKIQKHKDTYFKSLDEYEDYTDLMNNIKMIKEEKQKIAQWKQEEERRKKQKQQYEKKKKQEFEERQKKREQRKKREEDKKKADEQLRIKLEKQREQFINRNPHFEKIEACEYLIDYCQMLKPQNIEKAALKREQKVVQPIQQISEQNKEWQKQLKKGAEVIVSKKLKGDEEGPKKVKKEKKKKEGQEQKISGFTHHIDTTKKFENINLLPPFSVNEIDEVVKQLQEKIKFYQSPTENQIAEYKVRAEKQFDAMHGIGKQKRKGGYKQKNQSYQDNVDKPEKQHKQKVKGKKFEQKQVIKESEFPGLE